jgi:hypothetical protein
MEFNGICATVALACFWIPASGLHFIQTKSDNTKATANAPYPMSFRMPMLRIHPPTAPESSLARMVLAFSAELVNHK